MQGGVTVSGIAARVSSIILVAILLVACSPEEIPIKEPIGDFRLGHVVVSAKDAQTTEWSRKATEEQLVESVKSSVGDRFGVLRGRSFYHVAISVDAYLLPPPGVPVVASPKAGVHVTVQIWDDRTQTILNEEPKAITVTESGNVDTLVGSGYSQTAEVQLERATDAMAFKIEEWLRSEESPLPGVGPGSTATDTGPST